MARKPPRGKAASLAANERLTVTRTPPQKKKPPVHIPTAKPVPLPPILGPSPIKPPAPVRRTAPVRTLRQPPSLEPVDHGPRTQSKPFFPGQKPDRFQTVYTPRGGVRKRIPVYSRGKAGPAGDAEAQLSSAEVAQAARYRQKEIGAPGVIFRDVATSLVPKTFSDVAHGRPVTGGQIADDVANALLNFTPGPGALGSAAVAFRGFRAGRAASSFLGAAREGASLREAATAAGAAFGRKGAVGSLDNTPRFRTIRRDVMPALSRDPGRSFVHAQIDAQLPPREAAAVKRDLDLAAIHHGDQEASSVGHGTLRERRQAQASAFYRDIIDQSANRVADHPIPGGFNYGPDEAAAAKNLRQFTNPRHLDAGGPQNKVVMSRHPELGQHPVVGKISPEAHLARTQLSVGNDAETAIRLANWYRELGPMFEHFFGADAPAIIRGFAVSQANDSPAGGLQAVLRLRDKMMRGEYIKPGEASVVSESIQQAIKGEHVSKGMAAKLTDFTDSLQGKRTRTWTGDDIAGGAPTAIDIHAQRDLGRIDPKILSTLRERHGLPVAHLQLESMQRELARLESGAGETARVGGKTVDRAEALAKQRDKIRRFKRDNADAIREGKASGLVMDNPQASATGAAYNHALREYQAITDHYNAVGAFGKHDWTPAEVQALGWSGIQRFNGVVPEDATIAIDANTHHLSFRTLSGGDGYSDAPDVYKRALDLTKQTQARVIQIAETEGTFVRDVQFGPSGFGDNVAPSMSIQVIGSPEQADRIAGQLAQEFPHWEVLRSRPGVQGSRSKFAIEFHSPAFSDPANVKGFWDALQAAASPKELEHLRGFTPFQFVENGQTVHGIRVITPLGSAKKEVIAARTSRYSATIDAAVADLPYDVTYHPNNVEVKIHGEGNSEAAAAAGSPGESAVDPGDAAAGPEAVAPSSLWEQLKSEEGSLRWGEFFRSKGEDDTLARTFQPLEEASAEQQVREGLKGARSIYGKQKTLRSEEASRRAQAVDEALRTITDPDHARIVAAEAMRGAMPTIEMNGEIRQLDAATLRELKIGVNQRSDLLPFQKINLNDALDRAVLHGRVPTPYEMTLIEHVFGKQNTFAIASHAAGGWDKVINVLNIPRSLMATADLSAVGRQALVAGASHPVIWGRSWPTMLKSMRSGKEFEKATEAIKRDPLYPLALAARVSFTDIGEGVSLAAHEEQFASEYATKIPGIGHVIKGSARAYIGFLNKIRMDLFKEQIRIAQQAGRNVQDEKFLHDIGDVINAATGRGTIHGRAEHLLPALNTFLFSPRLMLSRINYLDPTWYVRLSPQARKEALRGLIATAGSVMSTVYLFSRLPGVDVGSTDPRSSDFGKIKIGNTRVDVGGGFQQYIRLVSEILTNTMVSSTTGEKKKLGSDPVTPTRLEVIQNFVYNKFAPAPSIGVNVLRGHDAVGNPTTPQSILYNNFSPLLIQDARDLYKERHGGIDGLAWALGGYAIGGLGAGIQTYGPRPTQSTSRRKMKGPPGSSSSSGSSGGRTMSQP